MSRACFIDIGNSRGKWWLCEDGELIASYVCWHKPSLEHVASEFPPIFNGPVDFIGVSSVLDEAYNQKLADLCWQRWQVLPAFARTAETCLGIKCGYDDPALLGIDRWLNVLAVARREPVCVVSCGTALTIDVIMADRHVGGYILPGLSLQLAALVQGTQRVRPHEVETPLLDFGKNTSEAVHHGILLSCVASIEKVYQSVQKNSQSCVGLVLTGGDAGKIARHLQVQHDIIPELLLLGLQRYFGHSS